MPPASKPFRPRKRCGVFLAALGGLLLFLGWTPLFWNSLFGQGPGTPFIRWEIFRPVSRLLGRPCLIGGLLWVTRATLAGKN